MNKQNWKFSSASSSDSTSETKEAIMDVATGINININRASTLPAEQMHFIQSRYVCKFRLYNSLLSMFVFRPSKIKSRYVGSLLEQK